MTRWTRAWAALAVMLATSTAARAQDVDTEQQAIAWLESTSVDEVRLGIETLGLVPSPRAADALAARIRRGLPFDLLEDALTTLGAMQQRSSLPVVLELTRHRHGHVRAKAIATLGAIGGSDAVVAIRRGLDDPDRQVRIAAVRAMSAASDRTGVMMLMRAFDRGLLEAAEAIGHLGSPEEVRALLGHLGIVPFDTLMPGLGEALRRSDLPQRLRLDIVARLTELATQNVRVFFEMLLPTLPGPANDPVKRAINDAILRISG